MQRVRNGSSAYHICLVCACHAGVYVPAQQYEEECEERRQLAARVEELEVSTGTAALVA